MIEVHWIDFHLNQDVPMHAKNSPIFAKVHSKRALKFSDTKHPGCKVIFRHVFDLFDFLNW